MTAPRIGVVGVRRVRQGLGEHLARFAVRAGAVVPAFVGTTEASIAEGRTVLARHGIDARGYPSLGALLADGPLDALVIASPAASHAPFLEEALAARLHVLCEKPLVWGVEAPEARAASFERRFREAGLLLRENCQWPETLPAFAALHPGALDRPPRRFGMELSPSSSGAEMLVDSLSHPLSLLQALVPSEAADGRAEGVRFSTRDPAAVKLDLAFMFHRGGAEVATEVRLARVPDPPRPAAYAIDGLRADRRIRTADWAMTFEADGRRVPVPDPTERLVAAFVRDVAGGAAAERGPFVLAERMRLLATLVAAY